MTEKYGCKVFPRLSKDGVAYTIGILSLLVILVYFVPKRNQISC